MRKLKLISVFAAIAAFCFTASAATFKYTDMITFSGGNNGSGPNGILNASFPTRSGEFNILAGGSGGDVTTVHTAGSFDYSDDGVTYTDKDGFVPGVEHAINPSFVSFYFRDNADTVAEEVTIQLENNSFDSGTVTLNSKAITFVQIGGTVDIFTEIDADGKLSFTITRGNGNFYLDYARLDVNTAAVPDGGTTSMLLGASLLGISALQRKFKR